MTSNDPYDPYPPSRSVGAHYPGGGTDAGGGYPSDYGGSAVPYEAIHSHQYHQAHPQGPAGPAGYPGHMGAPGHPGAYAPAQPLVPYQPAPLYHPVVYGGALYPRPDEMNWAGVVSLVLGLASLPLSLMMMWWATSIPGIILGIIGLVAVRNGRATNRGVALAGLISSIIMMLLPLLLFLLLIMSI